MDNWRRDGGIRTEAGFDDRRPRWTVRRAVWTGIGVAAVGFVIYALMNYSGILEPDLAVYLTDAEAMPSGELRTEWDVANDGDFNAHIQRVFVSSEALGFGDVTVTQNDERIDLGTSLDTDERLQVEIVFPDFDCDLIAQEEAAPKFEVRGRPLAPWAIKHGYDVIPATSLENLAAGEDWLRVATAEACG